VTLLSLILTIVVVGVVLWLINTYVPMQSTVKSILNIVVVIVLVVWLLNAFGLIGPLTRPIR
jgi:predicted membrane protein